MDRIAYILLQAKSRSSQKSFNRSRDKNNSWMKAQTMFLCKKASEFSASHYCIITQRIQGVELGKPFSLDLNQQRTNPKMLDIGMYIVPIVHCCQYHGVTLDQARAHVCFSYSLH